MKNPLTFAKIIPTPTLSAWSQAYNAGNLAAVVSLTQHPVENSGKNEIESELSLPVMGKDILNTLEAEYFTLETKNLTTVKQAVQMTVERIEKTVGVSICVAVMMENVLYVCIYGKGKALMKRKNKLGVLLEQHEDDTLISGSGYIENGDIVILETDQFSRIISQDILLPCLEHEKLSEIAETLFPVLHEKQAGDAAAIAFSYNEEQESRNIKETREEEKDDFEEHQEKKEEKKHIRRSLSHSRKLFLTIALIILIVLGGSLYFATKKQKQTVTNNLYQTTVIPAQKKYDEGKSLLDLNKNLALDDFQKAKSILMPAIGKLPPGSKENQDAVTLMKKIDDALTGSTSPSQTQTTPTGKQADASVSNTLSALLKYADEKYVNHNGSTVYLANNSGIITADGKTIIKNGTDWKDIGGFETYLGNIYLLDKGAGILKYVSSNGDYNKSNYFSGTIPDLSKTTGVAIDGSIWILLTDGTIMKYTHGTSDSFTVKGLDKPFKNPSRIFTSLNVNNMYVLDNGNSRIVVLDKNGNFLTQYPDSTISNAQDFDVFESQKKIYVLNGGKIWELDLK